MIVVLHLLVCLMKVNVFKLLLTLSLLVSSELLQASLLPNMRGSVDNFKTLVGRGVARLIALRSLKEMVEVELNTAGMAMLNDIEVGFVVNAEEVTAEFLAELILCEYNVRLTTLTQGKLARKEANILSDAHEQELVTLTTAKEHVPSLVEDSNCKNVVCLGVRGFNSRLSTIAAMMEHGSDMTFGDLRQRFHQRWQVARDTFKEIRQVLRQVSLPQAQLDKLTQADLQVNWDITSRVMVPKLGHTLSPGLVILTKIYEFAARAFALEGKEDLVKLSLLSILALKESPDDNIIMAVSTSEDSYPMRLTDSSLDEITALYLEQVN